jgi:hypothetical protein
MRLPTIKFAVAAAVLVAWCALAWRTVSHPVMWNPPLLAILQVAAGCLLALAIIRIRWSRNA